MLGFVIYIKLAFVFVFNLLIFNVMKNIYKGKIKTSFVRRRLFLPTS